MSQHLKNRNYYLGLTDKRRVDGYKWQPLTCAQFGCGKHLNLQEQLFGKYCAGCQGEKLVGKAKTPSLKEALEQIIKIKLK